MKLRGTFDTADTTVTGSLTISGSGATELSLWGNAVMSGSGPTTPTLAISGTINNIGTLAVAGNIVATQISGSVKPVNDVSIGVGALGTASGPTTGLQAVINAISSKFSAIGFPLSINPIGHVQGDQTGISAAVNISGLTNCVSAGGLYIFEGVILVQTVSPLATVLTLLWPQGITAIAGRWQVQGAAPGTGNATSTYVVNFTNAQSAIGAQMSAIINIGSTVQSTMPVFVNGTLDAAGATTSLFLGVNAKTSAGASGLTIKRGSYLRLWRIR